MTSIRLAWAMAVAVGGLIFGALAGLNAPLALLSLGVWFGIPQSVVVRHSLHHGWLWAVVTAIGMLAAWIVGFVTVLAISVLVQSVGPMFQAAEAPSGIVDVAGYVVAFLLAGAVVGYAQSILLPDATRWRLRWVISTSLGAVAFWAFFVGGLVVFGGGWTATNALLGGTLQVSTKPLFLGGGTLGGLAYGLITASTLAASTQDHHDGETNERSTAVTTRNARQPL